MTVGLRGMGGPLGVPVSQQLAPSYSELPWYCSITGSLFETCIPTIAAPGPVTTSGPAPAAATAGSGGQILQAIGSQTPDQVETSIAQAGAAQNLQSNLQQIGSTADLMCLQLRENCGMFTSPNAECTDCVFDPSKPAFLILAFAAMGLLIAFRK